MDNNNDDLRHIRSMMERSTKFLSLSGFSGVAAGVSALIGAYIAYLMLYKDFRLTGVLLIDLFLDAAFVIILATSTGLYFCFRKAKKESSSFWMPATKQIIKDFMIPMIVGGLFCLLLIYHQSSHFVASTMLIFYGLALIYAGARTYHDIKILGACEIVLGLLAGLFTHNGLIFWTFGFGVMHIIYGIVMYHKYERNRE